MKARPFHRQVALVIPFLVIFFFPIGATVFNGLLHRQVDWNKGLQGLQGFSSHEATLPTDWNVKGWWTGTFQKNFSAWWEGNCPGRAFFLRLFNQVNYSCFRSSYMLEGGILIGPDGQLDSKEFVLDAVHQGAVPSDQVPLLMDKLEHLRTQLQQQGKAFLLITTPNKAITYPETLPRRFLGYDASHPRPYEELIAALTHSEIPFVDAAGMIHERAGKSPYPLFMQGGVHWNTYATEQVMPAIVDKISQLTHKTLLAPTIASVRMVKAKQSQSVTDHDLAGLLNLLSRPFSYSCPNIDLNYPKPPSLTPNIVWAGGSFSCQMLDLLGNSPVKEDRPQLPVTYYGRTYFIGEPGPPISRRSYEGALSVSDIMVLEINENLPQSTLDGLPSMVEESTHLPIKSDREISFAEGGDSADYTGQGFGPQEPMYRRTDGDDASLLVPLPSTGQPYMLTASVRASLSSAPSPQRVEIRINDKLCGSADLQGDAIQTISATFSTSGLVKIDFHFPDAPQRALAFYSLRISPAKTNP